MQSLIIYIKKEIYRNKGKGFPHTDTLLDIFHTLDTLKDDGIRHCSLNQQKGLQK